MNNMSAETSAAETGSAKISVTPLAILAEEFIARARSTSDVAQIGDDFRDIVLQAAEERAQDGWNLDTAARRMVSIVQHATKRDMTDPASFLRAPLREVHVGAKRLDAAGEIVENTISDIAENIGEQPGLYARGIRDGLGKLEFET